MKKLLTHFSRVYDVSEQVGTNDEGHVLYCTVQYNTLSILSQTTMAGPLNSLSIHTRLRTKVGCCCTFPGTVVLG